MLYLFVFAHLVADFMLQPYWLVIRKRYWYGLAIHCSLVLICMLALAWLDASVLALWPAMLGITAVHFAADWWKVNYGDRIPAAPIVPFLLDQAIHFVTLVGMLSLVLPQEAIWSLEASAAAPIAIYGAALVVALFATPIGVMVWLDPRFEYVALAGRARIRSFMAAAVVIALAVVKAPLALPFTLLALVLVVQRPASPHPLDHPLGLLSVVGMAATMGSLLTMLLS